LNRELHETHQNLICLPKEQKKGLFLSAETAEMHELQVPMQVQAKTHQVVQYSSALLPLQIIDV